VEQGKAPDMIKASHLETTDPIDYLRDVTDPAKVNSRGRCIRIRSARSTRAAATRTTIATSSR